MSASPLDQAWRPIDTAPRNTRIIVAGAGSCDGDFGRIDDSGCLYNERNSDNRIPSDPPDTAHWWMPIPPIPQSSAANDAKIIRSGDLLRLTVTGPNGVQVFEKKAKGGSWARVGLLAEA